MCSEQDNTHKCTMIIMLTTHHFKLIWCVVNRLITMMINEVILTVSSLLSASGHTLSHKLWNRMELWVQGITSGACMNAQAPLYSLLDTSWSIACRQSISFYDELALREELSGACMFIQAPLLRPSTRFSILSDNMWESACSDDDYDGDKVIWCVVNIITLTNVRWLSC